MRWFVCVDNLITYLYDGYYTGMFCQNAMSPLGLWPWLVTPINWPVVLSNNEQVCSLSVAPVVKGWSWNMTKSESPHCYGCNSSEKPPCSTGAGFPSTVSMYLPRVQSTVSKWPNDLCWKSLSTLRLSRWLLTSLLPLCEHCHEQSWTEGACTWRCSN